jgi:hypothetical protein
VFRNPDARCAVVLLVLSLLLWLPRLGGPIDLRYDAGVYYILGTSLAEGKGYRLLHEPGDIQAVLYPPLLPAFVAAHQWALASSDPDVVGPWLRRCYFLLFLAYIQAVYALARRHLAPGYALLAALITALYVQTLFLSDLLFAEVPFALATVLFALFNRRSGRPGWFALTALLGVAAYLLRTAGMALLVAWVAEGAFRRETKQVALRVAVSLLPIAAWQGYVHHVKAGAEYRHPAYLYQREPYQYYNGSYVDNLLLVEPFAPERGRASLGDLAGRFGGNLAAMPMTLGEGVSTGEKFWEVLLRLGQEWLGVTWLPAWAVAVPLTALGCLTLAGLASLWARREYLIPLYVAASVGLICLAPWRAQFTRYLAPLTPFLALALTRLLADARAHSLRWPPAGQRAVLAAILPVAAASLGVEVLAAAGTFKSRHEREYTPPGQGGPGGRLFFYDRSWMDFDAALAWLKGEARPGDVVATSAPERAYLKTGLKAVMAPMEADLGKAQRLLESARVQYIIVDELEFVDMIRRYTEPALRRHPGQWQEVHRVPGGNTRIYRFVGRSPGGRTS